VAAGAVVVVGGALLGKAIGDAINEGTVAPARDFATGQIDAVLASGDANRIERAISVIERQLNPSDFGAQVALAVDASGVRTTLEGQREALEEQLVTLGTTRDEIRQQRSESSAFASSASQAWSKAQAQAYQQIQATQTAGRDTSAAVRTTASQTAVQLSRIESVGRDTAAAARGTTATLERKNFNPTINTSVEVNSTVSVNDVVRAAITQQVAHNFHEGLD
jgi:hypothetical protein